MPDTPSSDVLERVRCDHCGKPREQHSGAIPNCMMYPTYKNTLNATIERLSAELERRRAEMEYILHLTQRDDISDGGKVIFVATKAREALTHAPRHDVEQS